MGSKRPFDAEDFPELHCKHPRKLEYSNMADPCDELVSCDNAPQEPILSGRNRWHTIFWYVLWSTILTELRNVF